ncbi:MAG: DoxX family protein [Acidobacteria bacterium]|nr:DoxX family protein [Acidobacteriota bacterium]
MEHEDSVPLRWHLLWRVAFRFWFLYFVGKLFIYEPVVSWVAGSVFHAPLPLVLSNTGSGDKTYDWVRAFCVLCLAMAGTLLWSVLDRRRPNYLVLQRWLNLLLRFSLGGILLSGGFIKVVPLQMPFPSLTRLLQPYGEFSPMGVLWSSIGASPGYEMFTGWVEVVAGTLVLLPFTARFGVLLCLAVATQVFVLNMTYDVPVKLLSFDLILHSLVLMVPEVPRLLRFFFSNGPVDAATSAELFVSPRKNKIAVAVQIVFLVGALGVGGWVARSSWSDSAGGAPKPELYGIWDISRLVIDDKVREPLLTDEIYIRRIIFDFAGPSTMTIQTPSGAMTNLLTEFDAKSQTVTLTYQGGTKWRAPLRYARPAKDALVLDFALGERKYHIEAKRFDLNRFPLVNRGFRWVQEYPFNR